MMQQRLKIEICAARDVRKKLFCSRLPFRRKVGSVLSIENPGYEAVRAQYPDADLTRRGFAPRLDPADGIPQLILQFHDSEHTGAVPRRGPLILATPEQIAQIVAFGQKHWEQSPGKTLLVHCAQGVARSTAAALTIMAAFQLAQKGICDPQDCAARILRIRPRASPDPHMAALADEYLGLSGVLSRAVYHHPKITRNHTRHRLALGHSY